MDSRIRLSKLLRSRDRDRGLPQPFYGDEGFHRLDLELIWHRQWLFVGPACAVAEAGQWFTLQVGPAPLVITRGADGAVRAFHNTCRHRGSKICLGEQGKSVKLVCPYHQWTYELDGQLRFAPEMGPGFDPSRHSLKQAHCRVAGGYVFVCLADEPPAFDDFAAMVEPYMHPHALGDAKVAHVSSMVKNANWKLVLENNRECYHCAGSHPELMRSLSEFDSTDDPRVKASFADRIRAKAAEWDACGLPHASLYSPDKRFRVVRLPLAKGESMTMDGRPAVSRLLGELRDPDLGSVRLLSLPNSWNHLQADHALAFRVLPLGPRQTLVTTWWLVHKEAREGIDYDLDHLTRVWSATNDQDRVLAENNQAGVDSPAYEPGPYSAAFEFGVQSFVDWYTGALREGLGEPAAEAP